ncbi:MAG: DUF483 domain-containing protein [Candidatus Aenigmarchaeota archaeon]|nr:DUF483 domain-containing protein [Candidatus Aenigmarchaeota archaeon]
MLNYPTCCINAYIKDLSYPLDPDERIREFVKSYQKKNKKINPDSFCLEEFLPCRPECEDAASMGRKFENDLRSQAGDSVADIYRNIKLRHLRDVEEGIIIRLKKDRNRKTSKFTI